MKYLLTAILSILLSKVFIAQSLPAVYEVKSDTVEWQGIDPSYWQILEDNSGKLTFEEVKIQDVAKKFHYLSEKNKSTDSLVYTYWFRYRLKNIMAGEAKISLNSVSQYDDFYVSGSDNNWKHFISGVYSDRNIKNGLKNADCIPLVLQPGEEVNVYQRIHNNRKGLPPGFEIAVVSTEKIIQYYYIDSFDNNTARYNARELQEMFLEGVLLLSILMNLVFFRIIKRKEYLYFSLFLLSLGIDRFINVIWAYLKWEHPSLQEYIGYINLSWSFILLFLVQFVLTFFKVNSRQPVWGKLLLTLAVISGLFNIYATFFFNPCFFCGLDSIYYRIYSIMISVICIFIFITFLLNIRKKENLAKFVIAGGTPLMLFWGFVITMLATIPDNPTGLPTWMWAFLNSFRTIEVACIVWFVISFTLILFNQFTSLRKQNAQQVLEKERLQREREIERSAMIEQQKITLEKEVMERTAELKQSLEELKSAQRQLIQSEKMASLGELTAGIAHEIQNPLNFVNNFSDVNKELLSEMRDEMDKGNLEDAKSIANDVIVNEEKINQHGKRADAIVKGMLQHSRASSGQKELTDINTLCNEYLRLAYHGLRAKDKLFNAKTETNFDVSLPKIKVAPQDIGRVILNLINNAFYAVTEKKKQNIEGYEPTVTVSTAKIPPPAGGGGGAGYVEIRVKDNGIGIPQKVLDKIFQPFFTTKPTGQGTGLGLSLAYDIITKGHGGELKVETKEGEGSGFTIILPA